jgi:hypothetical protein
VLSGDGSDRYVVLKGGLAVPVEPLRLLLDLERRNFTLERDDEALVVEPGDLLTEDECRLIRRWKLHLLALIDYVPPCV